MTRSFSIEGLVVPKVLMDKTCKCDQRPSFTLGSIGNGIDWYVCSACRKPAPLNAINARLVRICEMCEDFYWVWKFPDRDDICENCV